MFVKESSLSWVKVNLKEARFSPLGLRVYQYVEKGKCLKYVELDIRGCKTEHICLIILITYVLL